MTDYLDEIQARADAATERAIREAAEPAIQAWSDAVETGAVDSAEIVEALAVAGVTWRIAAHVRTDVPRLVAALRAVEALCGAARPSLSIPPLDCTGSCSDGPCDCSGVFRVRAWDLDPDRIRTAIRDALEAR